MYDFRLHYAGATSAAPIYGAPPRILFGLTRFQALVVLGAVGIILMALGVIHPGLGLVLALGPTAAVDYREQALAKFLEAKALVDPTTGEVPAEKMGAFNELMADAKELDKQAGAASTASDNVGTLRERLSYYTEKATGSPLRFQETVLDPRKGGSLGSQFVQSDAYKSMVASGVLSSPDKRFSGVPFIGERRTFGAAAGDVIQTEDGGAAGDGVVRPVRLPGILPLPQRPLTIRSLFPNETMSAGDSIEYAAQTGFDRASGLAVKQSTTVSDAAGLKKQSSIAWSIASARAEWIATYFVTTRQALADVDQVRAAIDNQGRLMLQLEEEDMLLGGSGTPPEIAGLLGGGIPGIQTLDLTGEDNLDGIRTARRLVKTGLSRLTPDFLVVNPIDSEEFDLLKDGMDNYRGGNPIGNFTFDGTIWRLPRVESEGIAEGHALVGAGAGATVYERQPITVTTADQHADFFVRNLVVILFEERLAFPVYFPTAFVDVTLGDWEVGS